MYNFMGTVMNFQNKMSICDCFFSMIGSDFIFCTVYSNLLLFIGDTIYPQYYYFNRMNSRLSTQYHGFIRYSFDQGWILVNRMNINLRGHDSIASNIQ